MQAKRLFVIITVLLSLLIPNFTQAQRIVSIPDKNLATAIRQEIGNSITTDTLLNLKRLVAPNRGIKSLAGLEHARNLEELNVGGEYIEGQGYVNSNKISNFSPIARLTNLRRLNLSHCSVSDISFLAKLPQLIYLDLSNNPISNVSALTGLTQLRSLRLDNTSVSDISASDISPLAELTRLTSLDLSENNISDISALAALTQLTWLDLIDNNITDVSALAALKQLTFLRLSWNNITDVSALAALKQLTSLDLSWNNITDVSALAALTQLTSLDLSENNISDISSLASLTQLMVLSIDRNNITDVSALAALTQLTRLALIDNNISDIFPLIKLNLRGTQWDSTGLYINGNPLSYISLHTHIPAMQTKGIEIKFDNRIPTTLLKISGEAQQGIVKAALPFPFVVEVRDDVIEGSGRGNRLFAGVPVTFTITTGDGTLSTKTTKTDANGRASTHLTLGRTVGKTIVRVTAAEISQPVQFTATAISPSAPVTVPDANLRMKIMETLRKPLDDTPTATDMLKLTTLTANNADILDLTGLQHAVNLTKLLLNNNSISNVSVLAGLTELTTLDLRNNRISDVSPLVRLAQLRGPKGWDALYLQGNPLSDTTIRAHIPVLQAAGVNVRFDGISKQSRLIVRLVYFLPRDRQPQPDINAKMDRLIKDVQQFYEKQMENHGFGRKTFQFETDAHGNAVVYHINGRFDDTYYHDESNVVWKEINEQFDQSRDIYLTALDISSEIIGTGEDDTACGRGGGGNHGGSAIIPASGHCFNNISVTAHELGHAFGLLHDFSNNTYLMSYGIQNILAQSLSQCAAEWLDVHSAFNSNQPASTAAATIEMLPPSLASPPNTIRLRFKVTDPDGLHQVQLLTETLSGHAKGFMELVAYKRLNGNSNNTVDLVTSYLVPKNRSVTLQVIDVHGNISYSEAFPVDIASLQPRSRVVSIRDPNLASAIREEIGDSITTQTLLNLKHLYVRDANIWDLTGLEHAHNLRALDIGHEYADENRNILRGRVLDVESIGVSDISPLLKLTQLIEIELYGHPLSYTSIKTHIPALQKKGIKVWFNNRTPTTLTKHLGDNQHGTTGKALSTPLVVEVKDKTGVPFAGVPVEWTVTSGDGQIRPAEAISDIKGRAQAILTLGSTLGKNTVRVTAPKIKQPVTFTATATATATEASQPVADINGDGIVNIQDMVLVSSNFGKTGQNPGDVNGDGVVNISDLVLVAGAFGEGAAAAPTLHVSHIEGLTAAEVQDLLTQARQMALTDPAYLRGIAVLEQLLARLLPKETTLLPNYPNPFNPETWIPYQLAEPAEVTLTIYGVDGRVVRRLALGHQAAGTYQSKSRAAYWDGRNAQGERVASGVYFYTLTAGDFTATRKMLIRK